MRSFLARITRRDALRVSVWLRSGSIVLCFVMSVAFFKGAEGDSSRYYPLAGVFCRHIGLWSLLAGAWLATQAILRRKHGDTNPGTLSVYLGRLLAWLLATNLGGEVLWILAANTDLGTIFSYRLYTIWAVTQMLATLIILGLLVDCWHVQVGWPVRQVMLLTIPFLVWGFTKAAPLSVDDVEHHLKDAQAQGLGDATEDVDPGGGERSSCPE